MKVFNYPVFIHPRKVTNSQPYKAYEGSVNSESCFIGQKDIIALEKILSLSSTEINQMGEMNKKWLNPYFANPEFYNSGLEKLQSQGFSPSEAKSILDQAIHHSLRAKDWAQENEKKCGAAANFAGISAISGVAKALFDAFSEGESLVGKGLNTVTGLFQGLRGKFQFEVYGGRHDDDRAENKYQAERYGNKVAGLWSDFAYGMEAFVNPFLIPLSGLLPNNLHKAVTSMLTLPNLQWWRIRMPAEINQEFATDLLSYLYAKPLSMLGLKNSKEAVRDMDERGNLKWSYVKDRLARILNEGKEEKDKGTPSIAEGLKSNVRALVSGADIEKHDSVRRLDRFMAPALGLYGFATATIFTPIKSVFSGFNKSNRFVDAMAQTSVTSQQFLYLFRLLLPEYMENNSQKTVPDNAPGGKELNALKRKRNNLFRVGAATAVLNFMSPFMKLIKSEDQVLNATKGVMEESGDKLINYYFSKRRELIGEDFRLVNPELYEQNQVVALSDFVLIENNALV